MPDRKRAPGADARWLAIAAACCAAVAVALVIAVLVRHLVFLIFGAIGVLLVVAAMWWAVTARMPRRALGYAGVLVGLALLVVALLGVATDNGFAVLELFAVVALLAGSAGLAHAATRAACAPSRAGWRRVDRPTRPVLLCNPRSGGGKVEQFGLVELATSLGVEPVVLEAGSDLETLARDAVARGADCLGMAGGDGSQALVAAVARSADLPFVCVPAGTRNHFSIDLGLGVDPRRAMAAFSDAIERRVDVATVNERLFVNNASLGVYATVVHQEGYREAKRQTTVALLPELLGREERPFDLQFTEPGGAEVDGAFLILVSNNPYVLGPSLDASHRRRIDTGELGVFAVTASTGAQAAEVVARSLVGRATSSGHAYQFATDAFEVRSESGRSFVGIDGETLELDTPLRFRIEPGGLRLLVPQDNEAAALRRAARDVHLREIVAVAVGRQAGSTAGT
jgi:diacylglycerol kinase family enzyme